jgi:hypothetical protein
MSWMQDGTGLLVKRIRGRTLPQWIANLASSIRLNNISYKREPGFASSCGPDTHRRTLRWKARAT